MRSVHRVGFPVDRLKRIHGTPTLPAVVADPPHTSAGKTVLISARAASPEVSKPDSWALTLESCLRPCCLLRYNDFVQSDLRKAGMHSWISAIGPRHSLGQHDRLAGLGAVHCVKRLPHAEVIRYEPVVGADLRSCFKGRRRICSGEASRWQQSPSWSA